MFSETDGFKFRHVNKVNVNENDLCYIKHTLSFKSQKNNRYIAEVHEFEELKFCFIKFFLKSHRLSDNKYNLLTKLSEPFGIFSTCVNILVQYYKFDKERSLGLIGSNNLGESIRNTKRFKIYKKILSRTFKPTDFFHFEYSDKSVYLLLNKSFAESNSDILIRTQNLIKEYL